MATTTPNKLTLTCSFCTKDKEQVKKLIAGPGVYICDECIGLCSTILDEEAKSADAGGPRTPSLDEGPIDRVVALFGAMVNTTRSMEERLAEWARTLRQRGVPLSTVAAEAGLTETEATERFDL